MPSRFVAGELERELGVEPERLVVFSNGPGHDPAPRPSLTPSSRLWA